MLFLSLRCSAKSNCCESLVQLPVEQADRLLVTFTVTESWNTFRLEGISSIIWSNIFGKSMALKRWSSTLSCCILKLSSTGELLASLERSFQWLTALIVKYFPLVSTQNLPSSTLHPFPLIFSMWLLAKREPPSSLCPSLNMEHGNNSFLTVSYPFLMGQLLLLGSSLWPLSGLFPACQHLFGTVSHLYIEKEIMMLQVLHWNKKILYMTRKLCFDQSLQFYISHFIFITAIIYGTQMLLQSPTEVILEDPIILNYLKSIIFSFGGERSESGLFLVF